MLAAFLFAIGLVSSPTIGFLYFRDFGDVSQMAIKVKRRNMVRFIGHEYRLLGVGIAGLVLMTVTHFGFGAGAAWLYWVALLLGVFMIGFPYVWVHVGLRNQKIGALL